MARVVDDPIYFQVRIVPAQSLRPWPRTRGLVHGRIHEVGQEGVLIRA